MRVQRCAISVLIYSESRSVTRCTGGPKLTIQWFKSVLTAALALLDFTGIETTEWLKASTITRI